MDKNIFIDMSVFNREDFGACDVAILKQVDKIQSFNFSITH